LSGKETESGARALGEFPMSEAVVAAQEPSKIAEQSLRALWIFDSTVFESCRCACCGGLRHAAPGLIAPREARDRPEF
jgi:hypothetical protein